MSDERPDPFKDPPPRRVAALALLEQDGLFAIIHRTYWTSVAKWGLPGGSADPNELPRRAFSRHMDQKLGLRLSAGRLLAIDHAPEWPGRYHEGMNLVYHATVSTNAETTPAGGYDEIRWVTPDAAAALVVDHELLRLTHCVEALRSGTFVELLMGNPMN
ncbi:NUDIX domain-containing protein [Streptomyces vinaceus]|uniref:NUDIX domain-containing protein n=1 Tax=Streptomyces vinaceus TaxID=1960 RepID=UPI00382B199D